MSDTCKCGCNTTSKLIFACSGAADVGAVADQAARKLTREGVGKMSCSAGIGGKVSDILQKTKAADCIVALDGCSRDCIKLSLQNAGLSKFEHIRVTDLGTEKGSTDVSDENIAKVAEMVASRLNNG